MAEIVQTPIRSVYKDDSIVISNVKSKIDNSTTSYSVVNIWYDGTPMDDTKVDQFGIYSKYKPTGEYLRENKPQWGELFLEVDTVADLRDMTPYNQFLINVGYFKGVRLSGYYVKGDTPGAIDYLLTNTLLNDDGGSVFQIGTIKLFHFFVGVVDSRYFGIKGGVDETVKVQAVFNASVNKLAKFHKTAEPYLTGQIIVPSYVDVEFEPNCRWQGKDGLNIENPTFEVLFRFQDTVNSTWRCNGSTFFMNKAYYLPLVMSNGKTSEHNHIFMINGAKNITIYEANAEDAGGDGFMVGGFDSVIKHSENVNLIRCNARRSKRNGLSLIGYDGFRSTDSYYDDSSGTTIQGGIDIEPEPRNTRLNNAIFDGGGARGNSGKGVTLALQNLTNEMTGGYFTVEFRNFNTERNQHGFSVQFNQVGVAGKVRHINCVSKEEQLNGFLRVSSHPDLKVTYENCVGVNVNTSGATGSELSLGATFYERYSNTFHVDRIGGSRYINCRSIDNRAEKKIRRGFAFSNIPNKEFYPEDFYLEDCKSEGHTLQEVYIASGCKDGRHKQNFERKQVSYGFSASIQALSQNFIGFEVNNQGSTGTTTLRLPEAKKGYTFYLKVYEAQNLTLLPQDGKLILGLMRTGSSLVTSNVIGNFLSIEGQEDGNWRVIGVMGNWAHLNTWITSGRPTNPKIGQPGYNSTLDAYEYFNSISWVSLGNSSNGIWSVTIGPVLTAAAASFDKTSKQVALSGSFTFATADTDVAITLPFAPDYGGVFIFGSLTFTLTSGSTSAIVKSSVATVPQTFQIHYKTS